MGSLSDALSSVPTLARWLFSVILVGIFVAAIGQLAYDHLSSRITVKILRRSRGHLAREFVDIYTELIDENDRISPERILRFLDIPGRSPKSARALRRAFKSPPTSTRHILLVARRKTECVGFLKAVICPGGEVILLAYLGARARGASSKLIDTLDKLVRSCIPSARWLVFEMTVDQARRHESKYRLFREYARLRHYQMFRWDEYLQPDMEFEDPANTREDAAVLGVIRLTNRDDPLRRDELRVIIPALYRSVYAETFDDHGARLGPYVSYLRVVEQLVLDRVDSSGTVDQSSAGG